MAVGDHGMGPAVLRAAPIGSESAQFLIGGRTGVHEGHLAVLASHIEAAISGGDRTLADRTVFPLHLAGREVDAHQSG